MLTTVPLACFLSMIRPPGVQFEKALLQVAPVDKSKCPLMRDTNDVEFQLFTRYNPTVYQELVIGDDDKLLASNINFHDPTVIYFHAFMELPDENSGLLVREAYMLRGNSNVIMVDASRLEAGPWYFTAAENTWYIGRFAAKFIDYLVSRGLDLSKTHLIGHSLGGQSAGVAGGSLKTGRVSRITGLDPALPLFANLPLDQRLDPSDAHFVDVIHTDAGIFGVKTPTGHADFYPNGGISPQPGCELEVVVPQQFLLNKCDRNTKPQGYYKFDLKPKKHGKKTKTDKHRKVHLNPRDTTLGTTREEFTVIDTKRQALHKTKTQKSSSLYSIAESGVKNTVPKGVMTPENVIKPTDAGTRHLNKNTKNNDSIIHRKTDTSATEKSSKPVTIHAVRLYSTDKTSRQTNVEESSPDTPSALYSIICQQEQEERDTCLHCCERDKHSSKER
ncbi:phospholipase A1 member A-like [Choristoneura fumiferana]|uniref:phospholipase A1 member A-like n=1 Tax=Choristoneura fumiferana TaxID=7141 RepID=UPI003D15B0C8